MNNLNVYMNYLFYFFYMYCILRKTFSLSEKHGNLVFFFLLVDLSCINDQ